MPPSMGKLAAPAAAGRDAAEQQGAGPRSVTAGGRQHTQRSSSRPIVSAQTNRPASRRTRGAASSSSGRSRRPTPARRTSLQTTQKPDRIGTVSGLLPVLVPLRIAAPAAAGRDAAREQRRAAQHAALGSRRRPTPGFACNLAVGGAEQKGSLLVRSSGTGTKTHHFGAAFAPPRPARRRSRRRGPWRAGAGSKCRPTARAPFISARRCGRLHRPPACSRRAGGKRAFERPPREPAKELTQILRSAGEHLPRRWVLVEPKPADGPFSGGRITGESPPARLLQAGGRWTAPPPRIPAICHRDAGTGGLPTR